MSDALEQNVLRREMVGTLSQLQFTGKIDTPRRKSLSFALNFTGVISSLAWVTTNVLATATELFRFFCSPPAFSVCLYAHLFPSLQVLFDEREEHSSGYQ